MNLSNRRWLALDGTRNCRDLGGIPVSHGTTKFNCLYRGDALHELSEADQAVLENLRLTSIIDFRSDFEIKAAPNKLNEKLASIQQPRSFLPKRTHGLFDKLNSGELQESEVRASMCEQYKVLVVDHVEIYRQVLIDILAANGRSIFFHCTSGKDRTGIMAAIVLATLGAHEEEILADYVLTNGRIKPIAYLDEALDSKIVGHVMAAAPEYMETALSTMKREYGSVDDYIETALGISPPERYRLAELLVE